MAKAVRKKTKRKTKKKVAKKAAPPKISLQGSIPKLKLDMPLDAKKIKSIQRCIDRGRLRITVSKVDLAGGKLGEAWLYD